MSIESHRCNQKSPCELAAADETVAETRELLADARMQAREPYARRIIARQRMETARNMLRNHDILTNWNYLPEHLSAAEAHVDALVTWHDWATGKPVPADRLFDTVTALHDIAAHEPDYGTRPLANVLHHWAQQHGVELPAPPVQQQKAARTGIEIDL